jgi:hypothetical protein
MQVHIQERRDAGWQRDDNPKTAAIGNPVEARDSGSGLQSENPVLATGDRKKKPNVNESRRMKERLAMTAVARNEAMRAAEQVGD